MDRKDKQIAIVQLDNNQKLDQQLLNFGHQMLLEIDNIILFQEVNQLSEGLIEPLPQIAEAS
jgi:hypothetical protein